MCLLNLLSNFVFEPFKAFLTMKIISYTCIFWILFFSLSCALKENVIEETQEQITKKLDKEKAEKLISGTWELYAIAGAGPKQIVASLPYTYNRTLTFHQNNVAVIKYKDASKEDTSEVKYVFVARVGENPQSYIFSIADFHGDEIKIYNNSPDTLYTSSANALAYCIYTKLK